MLNVKVILGSTRQGRFSEKALPWIKETLSTEPNMQVEVLDLRDYDMPFYESAMSAKFVTNGDYGNEVINKWSAKIKEADAFIIIAPEYNHGYTAVLKNALDVIYSEWNNKPVAFIAYGGVGGARSVEQLRQVAVELHMASVPSAVHIMAPWFMLDETGALKADALDAYTNDLKTVSTQLNWWGEALKAAREKSA
jgi:NAD(P)H-dependent FMN reductase